MNARTILFISVTSLSLPGLAATGITVPMYAVNDSGSANLLGTIVITKTAHGLVFTPTLADFPPGLHGFHLHENASCDPADVEGKATAAMAAGGHLDPAQSNKHGSPSLEGGHLGDLPVLDVAASGKANAAVVAHRLTFDDVSNRALMIHAGGDNYADEPLPSGGGGVRIACGIVGEEGELKGAVEVAGDAERE